jgi:hypothetical protein
MRGEEKRRKEMRRKERSEETATAFNRVPKFHDAGQLAAFAALRARFHLLLRGQGALLRLFQVRL